MDFLYNNPQAAGTYAINRWFERMLEQFKRRAGGAGMDWNTAQMEIVMSPNMWTAVSRAYACQGLDLCAGVSTSRVMNASADQARERFEQYTTDMALPI